MGRTVPLKIYNVRKKQVHCLGCSKKFSEKLYNRHVSDLQSPCRRKLKSGLVRFQYGRGSAAGGVRGVNESVQRATSHNYGMLIADEFQLYPSPSSSNRSGIRWLRPPNPSGSIYYFYCTCISKSIFVDNQPAFSPEVSQQAAPDFSTAPSRVSGVHPDLLTSANNTGDENKLYMERYPLPATVISHHTLPSSFAESLLEPELHKSFRRDNPWWPCKSRAEFELISVVHRMETSEARINELIKSEFVSKFLLTCRACNLVLTYSTSSKLIVKNPDFETLKNLNTT